MDVNVKQDETEQSYRKAGIENEVPVKKRSQKSYMQPTISAASKAVAPKKKVLGESNDDTQSVSSDTVRKSQVLESKPGPYDPLTNYLSPRPKFLRYNPDRRKEILRDGIGLSDEDGSEGASDGPGSLASSPRESSVNGECDSMDDDDEEIEDERSWRFLGVLKYLVLFVVLVLSTLYVSSMNSPSPSPAVRAINDGCSRVQSYFVRAVDGFYGGRFVPDERVFEDMDLSGEESYDVSRVVDAELSGEDEATDVAEENDVEINHVGGFGIAEEEKLFHQKSYVTGIESRNLETTISRSLADGWEEILPDEVSHQDLVHDAQSTFEEENQGLMDTDEISNEEVFSNENEEMETTIAEAGETNLEILDDDVEEIPKWRTVQDLVHDARSTFEEENQGLMDTDELSNEEVVSNENEEMETTIAETGETNLEIVDDDVEEIPKWRIVQDIMNNTVWQVLISSGILILVTLVLGYQLMRKRSVVKNSPSSPKPSAKSLATEKCNLEIEKKEDAKDINTVVEEESEYSIQSRSKVCQEFLRSEAPCVEWLGEFAFQDVSSRSLRRCSTKDPSMEVEKENRQPVSSERMSRTKSRLLPSHAELDSSEFSAMSSPSYGSFTAEKKIIKIEGSGSGGVKKVITTPVRRSNRIRNNSLVSP